jgi:serine-type D-Ala-D-Ala carboxypeptidase/endopeptidase (penicillin-binding protein 4)
MRSIVLFCVLVALATACSSLKNVVIKKDISSILNQSSVFTDQFTGFSLFDLESNKYLINHNSSLRFTPASNTKLLTMYAVMKSFSDSIPALIYQKSDSGLIVSPTGDPTFLHPKFKEQPAYNFLSTSDTIHIAYPDDELNIFGSGWAWDDYSYDYQAQRSWWPAYGNVVRILKRDTILEIIPPFFTDYVEILPSIIPGEQVGRDIKFNIFKAFLESDTTDFERIIPFDYSKELLLQLLNDTIKTSIQFTSQKLFDPDTLFSHHVDLALAMMMKPSDNFLAEQLLIQAAWKNGFSEIRPFINYAKKKWLNELSEHRWVDGSGLSRYNLIAPNDQVRLLKKCYDEFGMDRMKYILPTGGEGTLKEWYLDDEPYIYAKTGTLSNNHNLSGYLITNSGKTLIFSFMNNHYTRSTDEVKMEMQKLLNEIRDAY